jgi:hypothetical protein
LRLPHQLADARDDLLSDDSQPSSYRSHPEQYRWANRNFRKGDRVVFVGPPNDQYQPAVISPPADHKLLGKFGTAMMGPSEDIRCYPDDPDSDIIWIRFDDDKHPLRQVSCALVLACRSEVMLLGDATC